MIARIVIGGLTAFGCLLVLGIVFETTATIVGHPLNDPGFLLLLPLSALAVIAGFGREETEPAIEVCKIFAFTGAAMILPSTMGPLAWLALLAGLIFVYGPPTVAGWNYLTVRRPLEQQAKRQQTLSAKLDADSELAEAMLRHERARAALADAEEVVADAERAAGSKRS